MSSPASRAVDALTVAPLGYVPEGSNGHAEYMAQLEAITDAFIADLHRTYGQDLTPEQQALTIELCLAVKKEYGRPMQRRYILFAEYARNVLNPPVEQPAAPSSTGVQTGLLTSAPPTG